MHLALLAAAPLFLCPFCADDACATVLLWLSLPAAVWLLVEPSRRSGEFLHDARSRVARAVVRDPVAWILAAVTVFAAIRWANSGIGLAYDAELAQWRLREAPLPFLPGCAKGGGFLPFATTFALTVLFVGCRHALGKKARLFFLVSATAFAALAAVVGAAAFSLGHAGAKALADCSLRTASYPGSAFGLYFLCGIAALVGAFECRWAKWLLFIAFAVTGTLTGLYFFAPTPVILLYLIAGFLMLAVACGYAGFKVHPTAPFKCLAVLLIAAALPVMCVLYLASPEIDAARFAVFEGECALFDENFSRLRDVLSRIASRVWTENPWLGSGLGTFAHDVRFNAVDADWKILQTGQASALNGWWHLLAERGIVGALVCAVAIGAILYVFVRRLCGGWRRRFFLPSAVLGPLALAALSAEATIDVSFLRADVLLVAGACLALSCNAFSGPGKVGAEPNA